MFVCVCVCVCVCLCVHALVCLRVEMGWVTLCECTRVGVRVYAGVYACVCVFEMLGRRGVQREREREREKEREREHDGISVKLRVYNERNLHLDDIICGHP